LRVHATIGAAVGLLLAVGAGALVVLSNKAFAPGGTAPGHPLWAESPWPFPMDQWGKGKAFQCGAADCGTLATLYIRPKLGSCNCVSGIANDGDLDRMSDFDLIGRNIAPLGEGRPITIGWMSGRSRAYTLSDSGEDKAIVSIVFNDQCDMIAATVIVPADMLERIQPSVIEFLNSKSMLRWAQLELGI
jgi:hypothetical protein